MSQDRQLSNTRLRGIQQELSQLDSALSGTLSRSATSAIFLHGSPEIEWIRSDVRRLSEICTVSIEIQDSFAHSSYSPSLS